MSCPGDTPERSLASRINWQASALLSFCDRLTISNLLPALHFQDEIAFLGIESSPSFVRAPEGDGIAKRFIRTLKEQLLWVRTFDTVEELRQALLEFKERFNPHWIFQRHL